MMSAIFFRNLDIIIIIINEFHRDASLRKTSGPLNVRHLHPHILMLLRLYFSQPMWLFLFN